MSAVAAVRAAGRRVRSGAPFIAEATVAAVLAWLIATEVFGRTAPFFAPAAALIVLGQARGQRWGRAVEVLLAVAGGVLIADVVATLLGPGTTGTIVVVVLLSLVAVVAAGGGVLVLVQGSVSGLYVAVVVPPTVTLVPLRFFDALVGGGVALVATQLVRPRNPLAPLMDSARSALQEVAEVIETAAAALERADPPAVRAALDRARAADARVDSLRGEVAAAREALWVHRDRRLRLSRVDTVESAVSQVDYVVRNVRVLVRAALALSNRPLVVPVDVPRAMRALAEAARAVADGLAADLAGDVDAATEQAERAGVAARTAVGIAGGLLRHDHALPVVMIVGQIRSCAIDLLRAAGVDATEAITRVDEALGLPPD